VLDFGPVPSHSDEKGSFSTTIAQDLIDEALKAVDQRTQRGATEPPKSASEAGSESAAAPPLAPSPDAAEAAPATDGGAAEVQALKDQLELSMARGRELMQKLKDEHEKMLRVAADLENFKKRAQKEKEEVQKFGIEKLLKDVLPVFDNFDRALDHANTSADFESFKKGVMMIRKQFEDMLGKHGVKAFSAKGQVFDPTRHEAMSAVETTDLPPNHVVSEVLRGFTLHDRLVRPALVVVSRAPEQPSAAPTPDAPPPDAPPADAEKPPESGSGGEGETG
jgi:molecular chaperone GrpE